ncbi:MAG: phosphoribosylaminoimidazolesuccinocarboxamide synthase [Parcubacteria group bacterium]|nr:phosphoribosylaminoimidazolesuccinocarboxamide synthase [Parcubacteria group bacterium]
MISRAVISACLGTCLEEARFPQWEAFYTRGKVRDRYRIPAGDGHPPRLVLITTDRVSAFDRGLGTIPLKGQVLNRIAANMLDQTVDICPNHLITTPHPNVWIVEELDMFLVEIVVRAYLTGSTNTSVLPRYMRGERLMYGYHWPRNLTPHQNIVDVFGRPIITPTTKTEVHDRPLTISGVVESGLVDEETWVRMMDIALDLFACGQILAAKQGLILVDTKYEMGRNQSGQITLGDEVHTPDSSRYWIAATYEERLAEGKAPDSLDKEFLRLWLKERGITGDTPVIPPLDYDIRVDVAERYIQLCERVTGQTFKPQNADAAVLADIEEAIAPFMF